MDAVGSKCLWKKAPSITVAFPHIPLQVHLRTLTSQASEMIQEIRGKALQHAAVDQGHDRFLAKGTRDKVPREVGCACIQMQKDSRTMAFTHGCFHNLSSLNNIHQERRRTNVGAEAGAGAGAEAKATSSQSRCEGLRVSVFAGIPAVNKLRPRY